MEATGIAGRERAGPGQPRGQVEAQEIEVAHPGFIVFFDFAGVPLDRTQRRAEGAMPRADLEHERPGRRRVSGRCRLEGHQTPYRGGLGGRPPALAREDDEDCQPGHRHRMDRNYRGGGDPIRRWTCALDLELYQNRTHGANQDYFRRRCFLQRPLGAPMVSGVPIFSGSLSLWERAGVRDAALPPASGSGLSGRRPRCQAPHPRPLSQRERGGRRAPMPESVGAPVALGRGAGWWPGGQPSGGSRVGLDLIAAGLGRNPGRARPVGPHRASRSGDSIDQMTFGQRSPARVVLTGASTVQSNSARNGSHQGATPPRPTCRPRPPADGGWMS